MSTKIKLAIVDDHQIVVDGILSMLKGSQEIEIVFSTNHPLEVIEKIKQQPIDILLTDIMMSELPGNELAKLVKKEFPKVKVLALSMSDNGDIVSDLINDIDIDGYALKNIGKEDLVKAITKIANGGNYFSDEVLEELEIISNRRQSNQKIHLTSREIEIISLIEREYNNKKIAETLFISERTVETHRKNIFRKTGTSSVIGLIKYAYENKLLSQKYNANN